MPPSIKTLQARIESRCHKTEREEIKKRLELARKEILASRMYDYSLANKNLGQAIKKLQEIILKETGA
jgi:guanylate kinase